jgi:hypothetical protein
MLLPFVYVFGVKDHEVDREAGIDDAVQDERRKEQIVLSLPKFELHFGIFP